MFYNQAIVQEEIMKSLAKAINNNQISHCYIFEGTKGMGKYETALIFAQSLFCENFTSEPCNKCSSCVKFNSNNHPDIHVINSGETTIKREEIDNLIESVYKKPYESSKKVFIIKDAHQMTTQAANTFLKTLEEPPEDSVIILLTTNSNLLLPTIVSRCQMLKFRSMSKDKIKEFLIKNCGASEELSGLASEYSKGVLKKAIEMVKGNDGTLRQREDIIKLFDKIVNSDSGIIYELENYFEENKDNIDIIVEIIMVWIRDIMFVQNGMIDLVINKDFIQLAEIHSGIMKRNTDLIEQMQYTCDNIKSNVNYKLAIDNMLLKIQEVFK